MKFTAELRVKDLLPYREFDRVSKPTQGFFQYYSVNSVINWLLNGNNMPPLELSVYRNTALLTDGNHRLAAANILGYETVPVVVTYYNLRNLKNTFYEHTIKRFKKII